MENSFPRKERAFHTERTEESKHGYEKLHGLPLEDLSTLVWEACGHMRRCSELKVQKSMARLPKTLCDLLRTVDLFRGNGTMAIRVGGVEA